MRLPYRPFWRQPRQLMACIYATTSKHISMVFSYFGSPELSFLIPLTLADSTLSSILYIFLFKMSAARPASHNCPPYDNAGGPLTSKPDVLPEPSISFNSRKQFKRNMISLLWRCFTTVLSLSLLILGLRIFSKMGELSHMEQRGFNAITILLGAFASLGLGSMLGYLGSMLKWRLLARRRYRMQDVRETNF